MTTDPQPPASPEFYLDQALGAFERARELVDPDQEPGLHGIVLHDIGMVCEATGRTGDAVDLYRRSVEYTRIGGTPDDLEVVLSTLASCLLDRADFADAREVVDEAVELVTGPGMDVSRSRRSRKVFDLGLLYERLGDYAEPGTYERALEAFEWSLSMLDEHTAPGSCAAVLRAAGRVQLELGRDQEAAAGLADAARLLERDGDRAALASTFIDLGRVYRRLARGVPVAPVVPDVPAVPGPREPEADEVGAVARADGEDEAAGVASEATVPAEEPRPEEQPQVDEEPAGARAAVTAPGSASR